MVNDPQAPAAKQTIDLPGLIPTPVVTGSVGPKFRLAGDVVKNAVADLPEEERKDILWFTDHCRRKNHDRNSLGTVLRKPDGNGYYSADSIVQLLTGGRIRRGENIAPMLDAIRAFRRVEEPRENQIASGFIETRMFRTIEKRFLKARQRQKILFVFGDSQIGKTESFKELKRRYNHGSTIYCEMPAGGSIGKFVKALAREIDIPDNLNQADLMERVIDYFDSQISLIVDECHNALAARTNSAGIAVFAFLRELYNRKRCGITLSFTNEGRDKFLKGPNRKAFEQLWRRRMTPIQLPTFTPDDDAALFAAAYGLPAADDEPVTIRVSFTDDHGTARTRNHTDNPLRLQREVLKTEGLGVWISMLQDAADMAQEQSRAITWGAVIKAHAQAQAEAEMLD